MQSCYFCNIFGVKLGGFDEQIDPEYKKEEQVKLILSFWFIEGYW